MQRDSFAPIARHERSSSSSVGVSTERAFLVFAASNADSAPARAAKRGASVTICRPSSYISAFRRVAFQAGSLAQESDELQRCPSKKLDSTWR